jgi:beta-ureidopropionase / N-carbamoyl-L-amino-acid hydrolase
MTFAALWRELSPIGRTGRGYRRYTWTRADADCRAWFTTQAQARGLEVVTDRNGNLWAWWDVAGPRRDAIVTGSHLDSVPDGGAFDGPLGVVSALAAVDLLRERQVVPRRPVAVTVFIEEEGARFGLACLGSKLMTGVTGPEAARRLTDDSGVTFADAMAGAGLDPARIGADDQLTESIGAFIELHIEQGRALAPLGEPIAVAESIWPHGRWRFDFTGTPDHAGTARLEDRKDPMLPFASTVIAAREAAAEHRALATFGKAIAEPGAANGIACSVSAWLDARAADEIALTQTVTTVRLAAENFAAEHDVGLRVRQESATPAVGFDPGLQERIQAALGGVPVLPTGAGHDAGVLAARVPAAMLFVRNPTGVSHSPAEDADMADCETGVRALADVLQDLACR